MIPGKLLIFFSVLEIWQKRIVILGEDRDGSGINNVIGALPIKNIQQAEMVYLKKKHVYSLEKVLHSERMVFDLQTMLSDNVLTDPSVTWFLFDSRFNILTIKIKYHMFED